MIFKAFFKIVVFLLLICISAVGFGQKTEKEIQLTEQKKGEIINACLSEFKTYYVYPDTANEIEKYIKQKFNKGAYSKIESLGGLTEQLRQDMRDISNDRHIWIDIMENLPITFSDASMDEIIEKKRRNNFGFVKLEILSGNIGYLEIDGFIDTLYAKEAANLAMGMLANTDAVILDLRSNHGGHENMVQLICSYFFEKKMQLNSLYFREADSLVQGWTNPLIKGKKLLKQKLYILISNETASGAESFAYSMKHYKRAVIIGERTKGAAHWKECYKLPEHGIFLEIPVARPINPVTKKGWEGSGVMPDIEISQDKALDKAHLTALAELIYVEKNEKNLKKYKWEQNIIKNKLAPAKLEPELLKSYAGKYGPRKVTFRDGALFYQRETNPEYKMVPLNTDTFMFNEFSYFRLQFVLEGISVKGVKGIYDHGLTDYNEREE